MVDTLIATRSPTGSPANASDARDARRRHLRRARAALSPAEQSRASHAVAALLPSLLDALAPSRVAGYLAVGGELDVRGTLDACRARGIETLLPVLDGERLMFAPFDAATPMRANRYRIDEPDVPSDAHLGPLGIDLVLVPLVGVDTGLNRLGMGGGFYDRSFAARRGTRAGKPWLIGVAHELQRVDDVFPDWWDVPLDALVTELGTTWRDGVTPPGDPADTIAATPTR